MEGNRINIFHVLISEVMWPPGYYIMRDRIPFFFTIIYLYRHKMPKKIRDISGMYLLASTVLFLGATLVLCAKERDMIYLTGIQWSFPSPISWGFFIILNTVTLHRKIPLFTRYYFSFLTALGGGWFYEILYGIPYWVQGGCLHWNWLKINAVKVFFIEFQVLCFPILTYFIYNKYRYKKNRWLNASILLVLFFYLMGPDIAPYFYRMGSFFAANAYSWVLRIPVQIMLSLILSGVFSREIYEPVTGLEELNTIYYNSERVVSAYSTYMKGKLTQAEESIFSSIKPGKILDVGCGTGRTTANLVNLGFDVVAFDFSLPMILKAQLIYPTCDFKVMDATDLKTLDDNSFEYVLFSYNGLDCIYPLENRIKAIRELHRVLKPDGLFIFSSHNKKWVKDHPEKNRLIEDGYVIHSGGDGTEISYTTNPVQQGRQLYYNGFILKTIIPGEIYTYYVSQKRDHQRLEKPTIVVLPERSKKKLLKNFLRKIKHGILSQTRTTIVIDLSPPLENILKNVKKTRRSEIFKGELLSVFDEESPFFAYEYQLFEAPCSETQGLFSLPSNWLHEGVLFTARTVEGKIVAALLAHERGNSLVLRRDTAIREFRHIHAALTWYAIRWAKEHGFKEFDQGGYNATKHPGISFWKARFGGKVSVRNTPQVI